MREPSDYQSLKIWIAQYVPLERDTLHWLIGAGVVLLVFLIARKPMGLRAFAVALALAFAIGCAMEFADRRDDIVSLGKWRWRASLLDVLRTVAIPLLAFICAVGVHLRRNR